MKYKFCLCMDFNVIGYEFKINELKVFNIFNSVKLCII